MGISAPVVRERTVRQAPVSGQKQSIDAPSAAFGTLQAQDIIQSGEALGRVAQSLDQRTRTELDQINETRALDLQNQFEKEANDALYNPQTGLLARRGRDAVGAQAEMQAKLEELRGKFIDTTQENEAVQEMLDKAYTRLEKNFTGIAQRHAFQETQAYERDALAARKSLAVENVALNYFDQEEFNKSLAESDAVLLAEKDANGWSDEVYKAKKLEANSSLRLAQIQSLVNSGRDTNVQLAFEILEEAGFKGQLTFNDRLKAEGVVRPHLSDSVAKLSLRSLSERGNTQYLDFEGSVSYVIDEIEGGDVIADEPGGAIAKYGINSKAHPNVDVANLTREQAVEIYKEQYWDAIDADNLPPGIRLMAFDAAVNHGVSKAKQLLDQSRGDPSIFINLRNIEYLRLARADSDGTKGYRAALQGWENRLQKIQQDSKSQFTAEDVLKEAEEVRSIYGDDAAAELVRQYEGGQKVSKIEQLQNQDALTDIVFGMTADNEQPQSIPQRKALINEAELLGNISKEYAASARRYLSSAEKLNGRTAIPEMAEIVMQMYDLNAQADLQPEDYLLGVRNVRQRIMDLRSAGQLTSEDEEKLNNQIKTLTSAKTAETTQNIAFQFGQATEIFEQSLPPETRGEAIRELFYSTAGRDDLTQNDYKILARGISDRLREGRRQQIVSSIQGVAQEHRFATVAEAEAANLPAGTVIYIGGRKAEVE